MREAFRCVIRIDMQSGSFIKLIADAYKVEEKTVIVYARFLREAGLLTSGARGVNAPHMRPLDAARMTIALLATDKPSQAVAAVSRYRAMTLCLKESNGELPPMLFHDNPTLEQVLVRLFGTDLDDGAFDCAPYFEIRENDKTAVFEMTGALAKFRTASRPTEMAAQDRREMFGIRRSRGLASAELMIVAGEMWADRFSGCDGDGHPLDLTHPWNEELRGADRRKRYDEICAFVRARDPDWMKGA